MNHPVHQSTVKVRAKTLGLALVLVCLSSPLPASDDVQTVYKWQDESGAWHFSDSPPDDGSSEVIASVMGPYSEPPPPDPNLVAIEQQQQIDRLEREVARLERAQRNQQPQSAPPVVIVQRQESGYVPVYGWRRPWFGGRPPKPEQPIYPGYPSHPTQPLSRSSWTHMPDNNPAFTRMQNQHHRLKNPNR